MEKFSKQYQIIAGLSTGRAMVSALPLDSEDTALDYAARLKRGEGTFEGGASVVNVRIQEREVLAGVPQAWKPYTGK